MSTILTRQVERLPSGSFSILVTRIVVWHNRVLKGGLNRMVNAYWRHTQRRDLQRLDARMLQDMGLREDHVQRELRKWFWQM